VTNKNVTKRSFSSVKVLKRTGKGSFQPQNTLRSRFEIQKRNGKVFKVFKQNQYSRDDDNSLYNHKKGISDANIEVTQQKNWQFIQIQCYEREI
jgi:hypothetical protein